MTALPRPAVAVVVAVAGGLWLAAAVPAAAQTARERYEAALAQDAAARTAIERAPDSGSAAARQQAIDTAQRVILRWEALVRRYPTSGYSDNALFQAADLARVLYLAYGRISHRTQVDRYASWLTREYPSSPLRAKARAGLRAVDEARQARVAAARTRPAPSRVDASSPAAATAPSEPRAATASSAQLSQAAAPEPRVVGTPPAASAASASAPPPAPPRPSAAVPSPGTGTPTLQTIERTVLDDVVRLTLPLDREVPFTHETLSDPPRSFIDLQGVTAAASLMAGGLQVDDAVRQVRVGRRPGATRVVLDLAGATKVSVFALYNPFRVVIDTERPPAIRAAATVRVPVSDEPPVVLPSWPAAADAVPAGPAPPLDDVVPALDVVAPSPRPPAATSAPAPLEVGPAVRRSDTPVPPPVAAAANADGKFSLSRQLGLGISRIVIDPGHGGHDPGTNGHGADEKTIVLDIALRLERLLQKEPGLEVVMTRRSDVFIPLEERTAIANREGADLFLSIHANASRNAAARGIETYYLSFASSPDAEAVAARENATSDRAMHNLPSIVRAIALNNKLDESRDLAAMVQEAMTARLSRVDTGIRSRGVKKAPFVVLIGAGMPSVLAEVAFLSNKPEAALIKTPAYRQRVAEALHAAVMKYRRSLKQQSAVADARD